MAESGKLLNKKFENVQFEEQVVHLNRVSKTVGGGRIGSFSSLVAIGNKNGCIGLGSGKAFDTSDSIKKAINDSKKNLYQIVLTKDRTIPHVVYGKSGATEVVLRPAAIGRGIIAGGAMRTILECLGVKDVVAKCIGSSNKHNLSYATINALLKLKSGKYYSDLKNKRVDFNKSTN